VYICEDSIKSEPSGFIKAREFADQLIHYELLLLAVSYKRPYALFSVIPQPATVRLRPVKTPFFVVSLPGTGRHTGWMYSERDT
jgi:hypothetical protein